jgi:hypothetical protein
MPKSGWTTEEAIVAAGHQGSGGGEAQAAGGDQGGQQRRDGALAEVGAAVGEGEGTIARPSIEGVARGGGAHLVTPATSSSTTCDRARSGSQRWPSRMWR